MAAFARYPAAMLASASLVLVSIAGCSGPSGSHSSSTAPSGHGRHQASGSPSPEASPSIPDAGEELTAFGISNGPQDSFSLPTRAVITARSDRPELVELAVTEPRAHGMYRYLIRALPAEGFTITKKHASTSEPAISFTGHRWTGKFTGDGSTSGITLRPLR